MGVSEEIIRTIVAEWTGQKLTEEQVKVLSSMYETLTSRLAAFPRERLRWVEPALHSVPATNPEEAGQ